MSLKFGNCYTNRKNTTYLEKSEVYHSFCSLIKAYQIILTSSFCHFILRYLYQARQVSDCVCVYMGGRFTSFHDFQIGFWNCSDSVVFLLFPFHFINVHPTISFMSIIILTIVRIKRRYQIQWARRVSGINLIRYAQYRKIGKPNNLFLILGGSKPKDLNRITKIGYGHLNHVDTLNVSNYDMIVKWFSNKILWHKTPSLKLGMQYYKLN